MSIIFNGAELVAHHNPGETPFLLVTFMGAFHEGEAETLYLMKNVVEAEGIACVGVTARIRNLYISPEIEAIAAEVRTIRRPGQKVIVLGQSSGGYAAVKFANLFAADYVLTFSPIFSLDPDDLGLSPGQEAELAILRSAIRFHRVPTGIVRRLMRPGPEDCAAPVLLAYDIHSTQDSLAADRYGELFPDARFVRARNLGHAVFDRLNDGRLTLSLLDCLNNDDPEGAYCLLNRETRNSEAALSELMVRIARWRPAMVPVALRTSRARDNLKSDLRRTHAFNTVLAYEMTARGDASGACRYLHDLYPELFPAVPADTGLFIVVSYHGDTLRYGHARGEAVFEPGGFSKADGAPVLLDLRGPAPRFVILLRNGDTTVVADRRGAEKDGSADGAFEVVPAGDRALVAFRRGAAFMRGDFDSAPVFTAAEALAWEQFALLPVSDPDAFRERAALNWLDQAAMGARGTAPGSVGQERGAAPRKTAFRSIMQRLFAG